MSRFKMNAIDRLFSASESRALPINSHVILEWDSVEFPLDKSRLDEALVKCRLEFPVLISRVEGNARVPLDWDSADFLKNTLTVLSEPLDEESEAQELARRFELEMSSSFRVLCYRMNGKWRMAMTVHHSLADGAGQSLLYDRFWKYYSGLEVQATTSEAQTLSSAISRIGLSRFWIFKMIHHHFRPWKKIGFSAAVLFDAGKCVDLSKQLEPVRIKTLKIHFDAEKWAALKLTKLSQQSCQKVGPTFSRNDVLLTSALRSFHQVCENPARLTRVMLPTDLRGAFQLKPCLQNWVSSLPCVFTSQELKEGSLLTLVNKRVREGRVLEKAIDLVIIAGVLTRLYSSKALHRVLVNYDLDPRTFHYSFLWSQVRLPEIDWAALKLPDAHAWIQGSLLRQPGVGIVLNVKKNSAVAVFEYLDVPGALERVHAWADAFAKEIESLGIDQVRH